MEGVGHLLQSPACFCSSPAGTDLTLVLDGSGCFAVFAGFAVTECSSQAGPLKFFKIILF